jgi:protein tyrosine/serine phosphatase
VGKLLAVRVNTFEVAARQLQSKGEKDMADREEAIAVAERQMDKTLERLQRMAASNAPFGARQGAENEYGQAYQVLVRLGVRRQLRAKYRGR